MKLFNRIKYLILFLSRVSVINTIRANFRLLKLKQAIKLPIIIYKKTTLKIGSNASLTLKCSPRFGILRIGAIDFRNLPKGSRSYIAIDGSVNLHGEVRFGYNTHIVIGHNADFTFGGMNIINHDTRFLIHEKITLEYGARVGWNTQICDTAFHYVIINGFVSRKTKPIVIGREAWVSSFCNVGRGAYLPNYSVLSTCSLLNKDFSSSGTNLLIAGIPAKVIKTDVKRIMESVDAELCDKIDNYFNCHPEENKLKLTDLK